MRLWKGTLPTGGGVAACAACCALPLAPASLVAALGLSGGFAEWGERGLLYALIALGGSYGLWRWLTPAKSKPDQTGCGRAPAASNSGNAACKLPAPPEPDHSAPIVAIAN